MGTSAGDDGTLLKNRNNLPECRWGFLLQRKRLQFGYLCFSGDTRVGIKAIWWNVNTYTLLEWTCKYFVCDVVLDKKENVHDSTSKQP